MTKHRNPWTAEQLMNDMHLGSRREAALIAAENGNDAPLECGQCGGPAHYKQTIGTEKCYRCGSLKLTGPTGIVRWSDPR